MANITFTLPVKAVQWSIVKVGTVMQHNLVIYDSAGTPNTITMTGLQAGREDIRNFMKMLEEVAK